LGEIDGYSTTAETTNFVNQEISGLASIYYPQTDTLDQIAQPQASLNLNNQRIINLASPQNPGDAVNI
jgi:hypothetical protein